MVPRMHGSESVHSISLTTSQVVVGVVAGIISIAASVLGAVWWIMAPRLDAHIDRRAAGIVAREVARSEQEQSRLRAELYQMLAAEKEQRREQLSRIEADISYIRQRVDVLANHKRAQR